MSWDVYPGVDDNWIGKRLAFAFWRFYARAFDCFLSSVFFFCATVPALDAVVEGLKKGNLAVWFLAMGPVWSVIWTAAWTALAGTSPGKWLVGIRVEMLDGSRPSFWQALRREWYFLLHGMWIIAWMFFVFAWVFSAAAIVAGVRTKWDRKAGTRVFMDGQVLNSWTAQISRFSAVGGSTLAVCVLTAQLLGFGSVSGFLKIAMSPVKFLMEPVRKERIAGEVLPPMLDADTAWRTAERSRPKPPEEKREAETYERRLGEAVRKAYREYEFRSEDDVYSVLSPWLGTAGYPAMSPEEFVSMAVREAGVPRRPGTPK